MARRYYSKRHFDLVCPKPDTAEQAAERISHRKACEQAILEREERFGELTADNALEAMEWQTQRIKELTLG